MSHMRDPNSDVGCGVAWRGEKIAQEVLGGRSMPGGEARSLRGWLGLPTTRLRSSRIRYRASRRVETIRV